MAIEKSDSDNGLAIAYDGNCNFCRSQIAILKAVDFQKKLKPVSAHESASIRLFPTVSFDQMMEQMWVKDLPSGEPVGGAVAVRMLSRKLPLLWPIMPFLHIPGSLPLWTFLYKFVARNRYRIAGKNACENDQCRI